MKNKFKSKLAWFVSFASVFNLSLSTIILSSCSKNNNGLSYVLDPKTGRKYFFDNLSKTNICGTDGNIIIGDQQWERENFNLPIFLSDKIKKIDDNFLANCPKFDQQIIIPNSCLEIGNNFLFNCHKFNSNLHLAHTIKTVGNNFLYMCIDFDKSLNFDYLMDLTQIGSNFLLFCEKFNHEIIIKSKKLKYIGDNFLRNCIKFNSNFYLNSPVLETIGDSFFDNCANFNKPVDLSGLVNVKSIRNYFFHECYSLNSKINLPPNITKIGNHFMSNDVEYNCLLTFPNSVEKIGDFCCTNFVNYNHDVYIPESIITKDEMIHRKDEDDEYGIGDYFFYNCWSMTSTIDFGLHDITKILKEGYGSLSCDIPPYEIKKSSKFIECLRENWIALYFLKKIINNNEKDKIGTLTNFFDKFSFDDIDTKIHNKINGISQTLSFFENLLFDEDWTKKYFGHLDEFKNVLSFSKKLELILEYFYKNDMVFRTIFLEFYKDKESIFENDLNEFMSMYSHDKKNDDNEIKLEDLCEKILSISLLNEVKDFCDRHNYFYKGLFLKSLNNTSQYKLLSDVKNADSWKYSNNENIYPIKFDSCKEQAIDFVRVLSSFSECKEVVFLLNFISSKIIDDKILVNDELKKFFISKVKALNQLEIKLFCFALNNPNKFGLFEATRGLVKDEAKRKIKKNLDKILESEPNLKKDIFASFLEEQKNDANVINFDWTNLVEFLDIIGEYGLKYDPNNEKNLDTYMSLRKSLKKIGEHFDENERILILDWINKLDSSKPLKKYQLLTRIALSNLIDKNLLIDQMFDELFHFDLNNNNVIKKINGDNITLNESDNIVLNKIQSEFIFKKMYEWFVEAFENESFRTRNAMLSYLNFFKEKLWNEDFLINWFNEVITKNNKLDQIFAIDKIKNALTPFWEKELTDWERKSKSLVKKYDKIHDTFANGLSNFFVNELKISKIVDMAKKVLIEKIQRDLIGEIKKIGVEAMKDRINNQEIIHAFVNDLKNFFNNGKEIFADCSFLEKNNNNFIKKLEDKDYVRDLFSLISSFKLESNKKDVILLYYYLININYHNDILEKLLTLDEGVKSGDKKISDIFYERIFKTKRDFYEKLSQFSFYDDAYEPEEKNFFLKQMYNYFLKQLFDNKDVSEDQWFKTLFYLSEDDKALIDFINNLPREKKEKWDAKCKKNQHLYRDFKYQIIFSFKTTLAEVINDTKNKLLYFKPFANDITTEDSYAVKMLNEIIKLYDLKILEIKNGDNFQKDVFDELIKKENLFNWLQNSTIDYDKWNTSITSHDKIIEKIKNYKYTELNCFAKHIDKCEENLNFLRSNDHQIFSFHLNQEIFKQLKELHEKWKQNKSKLIAFYLAQLHDKDYSDWNSFAIEFNNKEWKEQHLEIIKNLMDLLDCDFNGLNEQKINDLEQEIKDDIEDVKNNHQILSSQLKELHEKWKQNKSKLIAFYLAQLHDKDYSDWNSFAIEFNNKEWKENEKNRPIIEELCNLLHCRFDKIYDKINGLDKQIKDTVKNIVKNHHNLFNQPDKEEYISIKEIKDYCEKVNTFFNFIDDISLQCNRIDLKFSDSNTKEIVLKSLKKIGDCIKTAEMELYENKAIFTLYQDIINALATYDKTNSFLDLLDVIEKANKLNKLFLENKNVVDDDKATIVNFSITINDILNKLKKENEHHENNFFNNFLFDDFYLIYGFGNAYGSKTNISIKKMDKFFFDKLNVKINDLSKCAKDMSPIDQFISQQNQSTKIQNFHKK